MGVTYFNVLAGGDVLRISEHFTSPERIILPDAENHMIVSLFVWTQYRNVKGWTDGQTDRQT